MALPLKYNTASQTILLGPFLDDTDGKTPETGLTIANTDIKLNKHNGTTFTNKNSGGAAHIANGYYYCTLDAADTNTLGRLFIAVNMTSALPVWHEFEVMSQQEFDAKYGSSYAQVNVMQIEGQTLGTHGSGHFPSDLRQIAGTAVNTSSAQLGVNVVQVGGTNQTARDLGAQCDAAISSRAPATTALSNATWTDAKAGYLDAAISSRSTLTAADVWGHAARALTDKSDFALSSSSRAAIVDEVWDELRSGHTTAGTFGQGAASVQGNVTGSVNSVVSGVTVAANNDKTGYSLSSSGIDAIWDATGSLGLSFEVLLQRAYEMINNRMTVNESTGLVTLLSLGGGSTIAAGSVTSASGTTTRNELSWT